MKRVFLDANVLISVLNKEFPLFNYSSRILSLANHPKFKVYTSPMCLAIAFHFAEKKNKATAMQKISILFEHIMIVDNTSNGVMQTISNSKIDDFEGGLTYYTAKSVKCNCIITEDIGDFHFSEIEVLSCKSFFEKYLLT